MAKIVGLTPRPNTIRQIEEFENRVRVRRDNTILLNRVYVDLADDLWSVAIAYNPVLNPGLVGPLNQIETKYSYLPQRSELVRMESNRGHYHDKRSETSHDTPDAFVLWALNAERALMTGSA